MSEPEASVGGSQMEHRAGDPWARGVALAGVLPLPLVMLAGLLADLAANPGLNPGSSDAALLDGFREYRDETLVASSLYAAAAALTLVFLGALWVRLRAGAEWEAVVAIAGGVVAGVLWLILGAGTAVVSVVAADYSNADAARFLMIGAWETARLGVAPYLVMVAAATVGGFRFGVFPTWFNIFGLAFTALLVVGMLPVGPAGLIGSSGTVWTLLAGLVMAFGQPGPAGRRTS